LVEDQKGRGTPWRFEDIGDDEYKRSRRVAKRPPPIALNVKGTLQGARVANLPTCLQPRFHWSSTRLGLGRSGGLWPSGVAAAPYRCDGIIDLSQRAVGAERVEESGS